MLTWVTINQFLANFRTLIYFSHPFCVHKNVQIYVSKINNSHKKDLTLHKIKDDKDVVFELDNNKATS